MIKYQKRVLSNSHTYTRGRKYHHKIQFQLYSVIYSIRIGIDGYIYGKA